MQGHQALRRLVAAWDAIQVELHGQYSLQRLASFRAYAASASSARVATVLLLTPIPCLLTVLVSDSIPLEPPERGIGHTHGYWVRGMFTTFIYSYAAIDQIQFYVPQLHMSPRERIAVALPVTCFCNSLAYVLSRIIGFPLPFALTMSSVPWSSSFFFVMVLLRGRFLRQHPTVLRDLLGYLFVCGCQLSMVVLYPAFYSAFAQMSSTAQTAFVLVLPLVKLVEKNLISHFLRDREDVKPEVIIFNVEIFNALFVSCCMQSSTSFSTNLVIMAVDVLQATQEAQLDSTPALIDGTQHALMQPKSRAAVLTVDERLLFVRKTLQVLYMTEFLLLIEFTEVVIPVVYVVYLVALYNLPNRVYYPQLRDINSDELYTTVMNVSIYAAMEFLSLVVLATVLKRRFSISAVRQLVFVLDKHRHMVQSKLVLWVVFMLQSTLVHLGADYTFKFAWLHQTPAT